MKKLIYCKDQKKKNAINNSLLMDRKMRQAGLVDIDQFKLN